MCVCVCACILSRLACLSTSYSAAQNKWFSNRRILACRNVSPFLSSLPGVQEPSRHRLSALAVKTHNFHRWLRAHRNQREGVGGGGRIVIDRPLSRVFLLSSCVFTNVQNCLLFDPQISRRGDRALTPITRVRKRPVLSLEAPV